MNKVTVERKTTESKIEVTVDFSNISSDYREKINTPIVFLNHMIEHIIWRGGVNIRVTVNLDKFGLTHVVAEDVGICFGKAVKEYLEKNVELGINGYGDGFGIIDEAKAHTAMSFENRAYIDINYNGMDVPPEVEGMYSNDLETFLEGFVQGAGCALHIDLLKGRNGHHIWEAIYRSFGTALKAATSANEDRKNMTSGVAGTIEYTVK